MSLGTDFLIQAAVKALGIEPAQVKQMMDTAQGVAVLFAGMVEKQQKMEKQLDRIEAMLRGDSSAIFAVTDAIVIEEGYINGTKE